MADMNPLDRVVQVPTTHAVGADNLVFHDVRVTVRPADVLAMLDDEQCDRLGDLLADSLNSELNHQGMHLRPEDVAEIRQAVRDRREHLYEEGYGYEDKAAAQGQEQASDA